MSSTTVAQHSTQPLNFGPEWLRALSTPESTTPVPSSSGSGNVFKFSATKYRYSKDEILALRANVTERLAEDIRNEIMENLKDVESIFRPNIIEPLTMTTPSTEESAKMNSPSSYISGRTPGGGGGGRGGNNSQSLQPADSRNSRGGSSTANGRGGSSRGRIGRDSAFGPNRRNNTAEDTGENGGGGGDDQSSSSWSRGGFPSREGGRGGFANRVRSYDDREQSQPFRRGGGARQPSEGWRRPRTEDEENTGQNEESSTSANGSASLTSRNDQTRRDNGSGSMEHRTKSNDKWNYNDDRPGPSNSYESNQPRAWRQNATLSDRDLNSRRLPTKRERMPEWMDDNNDGDNQLSSATFEHDGTFTGSSSIKQNYNSNSNEQDKFKSQSSVDETSTSSSRGNILPSKQHENNKTEKPTPPQSDKAVVNVPTASETIVSEPKSSAQKPRSSWEDEFEPSDVATNVVELTLAEDHDYSSLISSQPTSSTIPSIPKQRIQPLVAIDDKQWFYKDPQNTVQGPFSSADMERWFTAGYFTILLPVKRLGETHFSTIQQLTNELGRLPFQAEAPSLPPPVKKPQSQPIAPEPQKFNPLTYATPSIVNNAFSDEYLMQKPSSRQNMPQSVLFNRQASVPASDNTDRKPMTSPPIMNPQLQAYFASQQHSQSSSSLFPSNLADNLATTYQQQQQQPPLQRSTSVTSQQQLPFNDVPNSFRQMPSQANTVASFFGTNLSTSHSQKPDDIMTRLAQAMQSHGQQQQEKIEEQRRFEQQRRELDIERLKLAQQADQLRLQREEDERRQSEEQRLDEDLRKKKETAATNKQTMFDQMKEMTKVMDQKTQQPQVKPPPKMEIDPFVAFQQSLQFQKEQQSKIEAQKAENIRRYQQQYREPSQPTQQQQPQQQQQQSFKLPDTANWARHASQSNDQNQPLNFAEIQKQEQEQDRRAREAAMAAQQLAKSDALNIPNSSLSSSSGNKPGSWARTLFAGGTGAGNVLSTSGHMSSEQDLSESPSADSPITSYNQQATNAPKSRSSTNQQSVPWSATNTAPNTSLQDIQRQQSQSELKQQQQQPPPQQPQQTHSSSSSHSAPAWGGIFQHSTPSPQSSSSIFWGDNQHSVPTTKSSATKPSVPWTELKSAAPAPTKSNSSHAELTKSEREAKYLFTTTRTQDALSKWTYTQFKDNLQAIDVPTLVQLLKDIDTAEEIVEYVQPYIGSVIKSKEFANDFLVKRKQLASAEPELDNERLNELAMAPTSSLTKSGSTGDEGFQLASSNGQKKKAKKMKGQKIDVKQLGFMVNNRPEHRDDIEKVPM